MTYDVAFFGSSLVSARWNGAATYYRGILRALAQRGHRTVFYEPDAYGRQQHRDLDDPGFAEVVVYDGLPELDRALKAARSADLVVKASGVGVHDELLESAVLAQRRPGQLVVFWDVDAPATLSRLRENPSDPFLELIPKFGPYVFMVGLLVAIAAALYALGLSAHPSAASGACTPETFGERCRAADYFSHLVGVASPIGYVAKAFLLCAAAGGIYQAAAGERSAAQLERVARDDAAKASKALGRHDGATAVRFAEQAVAARPQEAAYRALLGQAYLLAGRFGSARTALADSLSLSPGDG